MSKQTRNRLIDTESILTAASGRGVRGMGEKGVGIKEKNSKQVTDTDSSVVLTRSKAGEVEEGKGGINGDGRTVTWGGEYRIWMMY